MPKLTIFLSDLIGGGAERVMLNLASGFAEQGYLVDIVLARKEGILLAQIPSKVELIDLNAPSLLRSLPALISYLKKERPIALLSALEDTNIVALVAKQLARVPTPVIVTVHNNLSQESRHANNWKRRFVPSLVPWFYPWANAVVAVSQGVAEDLVKLGLRSPNLKVIYNPIITPEFTQKLQQTLNHSWFNQGEPPVILGVGRLNQQKDFPTLIRAFAEIRRQQPARLMILGEGEERGNLETLIQKLGIAEDVSLPGFVDNPYIYMAQATVLVLSSAWEGFGNVLVEAMAAGTPVISTNCESGPREILMNGKYGKLVSVGDWQEMAKAILQTFQETPRSMILQKRANEFSLTKAISSYQYLLS